MSDMLSIPSGWERHGFGLQRTSKAYGTDSVGIHPAGHVLVGGRPTPDDVMSVLAYLRQLREARTLPDGWSWVPGLRGLVTNGETVIGWRADGWYALRVDGVPVYRVDNDIAAALDRWHRAGRPE